MMNEKYINATKLTEEILNTLKEPDFVNDSSIYAYFKGFIDILDNIPAANVAEVKYSTWQMYSDGSGCCKNCNHHQKDVWDMDGWQNYCGHCGALMYEGISDDDL